MKHLFLSLSLLILAVGLRSQTTAMDYTGTDCTGANHHFYSELDSGYVLVVDYIMLSCSPCIIGTNGLKSIVAQFEQSHPGRVRLYSFGYLDAYTCQQLTTWKNSNTFTHRVFSGGNSQVNYYGGMGMPTIVVLSGNEYSVEYRKLGYSSSDDAAITAAIQKSLAFNPLGFGDAIEDQRAIIQQEGRLINITQRESLKGIRLMDITGKAVLNRIPEPSDSHTLDLSELPSSVYLLRLKYLDGREESHKIFLP